MKKAIFRKFVWMILLALVVSSTVFCMVMSRKSLKNTERQMVDTLHMMDYALDYEENLEQQIADLCAIDGNRDSRCTVILTDGTALADNGVADVDQMENHLNREEVQTALSGGEGFARRYSDTIHRQMLYAAIRSSDGQHILRLALPYEGLYTYLKVLIPAVLLGIGVALLASFFLAERFASSITNPLNEIAGELRKVDKGDTEIFMKRYEYEELNVIIEAMNQMSTEISGYVKKLELERIIRQEFFSNASHELKTPITSIKGYTELLESGLVTKPEVQKDFLGRIESETDRMTNLINDILMISKLETREVEVEKEPVAVYPLLEDLLGTVEPMAAEQDIKVYTECRPLTVIMNPQQLRELISNLLVNAIKYNRPEGIVRLTITSEQEDMILIVSDTGVGIPKEAQRRVFERFYRVDKGRSRKMGGTGLGLAIVKHIVGYYGGTISLDSQVDVGTTFTVRLPVIAEPGTRAVPDSGSKTSET